MRGEVIPFNLGRLPDWSPGQAFLGLGLLWLACELRKGGGLEDEGKDHFPEMRFRPKVSLEHLV